MRYLIILIFTVSVSFAIQTSDKLFECTEIFQERKSELLIELERIDEQKQALDSLKIATEALLKEKEAKITLEEDGLNQKLSEISKKEASITKMLTQNEKVLKELKSIKMNKVAQSFAKMKAAATAEILSNMDKDKAVKILQSLKPKTVGQILTKMDAKKAAQLTILLSE